MGSWTRNKRVELLAAGRTQWGCKGMHHAQTRPDCTPGPHHHHTDLCTYPTPLECEDAGVPWREPHAWDPR